MRPINLKISAFGPYAGEVEIEFDRFLNKGIYLISGCTGAGKSTIFEAIKFALYGEDNGEVRSKYASDSAPTYVEMVFVLRNREYKIVRNPKYLRPKSRGEGSTVAKAEAELIFPDGRVVSGYANVTREIVTLTGLNSEQFSKIVMIAQGKFRELLVADTASRSKIFRDIFKTESYDKIQRRVKNKYLEAYKENSRTNDSIKQYVQGVKINETYDKRYRLENIANQDIITDIDEVLDLIKELIALDEKLYEDNNEILTSKNDEIQKKTGELAENQKLIENIDALKAELIKLLQYENEATIITEEYEKQNSLKPVREQLLVELEQEKVVVEKYKQYEVLIKDLDKAMRLDESLQNILGGLATEKTNIQNKLIDLEKKAQQKSESEKQLLGLEASIKQKEEDIRRFAKIELYGNRIVEGEKNYQHKLAILKEKEIVCENAKNEYDMAFKLFINAQAGIMARELENNPNAPCPVCGSTTHVNLAKLVSGAPTEGEVNKLRAKYDEATNEVMKASGEAGSANNANNSEKNNLSEALREVDETWTIENYYDKFVQLSSDSKQELSVFKQKYTVLFDEINMLKKEVDSVSLEKQSLEDIDNKIKIKESELNNNKLDIKTIETNLENIKSQLKTDNESEARESLRLKEEKYKNMVDFYEKAVNKFNEHNTQYTKSKTIVSQLVNQLKMINMDELSAEKLLALKDNYVVLVDENSKCLEDLKNIRQQIITVNNDVYSRIQNNKDIIDELEVQKRNLGQIASRLSSLKALSDTLNGEMEGKDKIKLETFVQIAYFEQVILKANTKLFEMTEGQYEFIRDVSSEDKRSKSGLELSVYDHYNGTVRSVKTLSGGEGFMAALSLALGMADIIEESASGISIDTMFIDEGFGSLDEAALEQAMRVLASLSEGNKLVGIISHVSTLKERIEKQINVEKNMSGGSTVRVVV